MRGILILLLLSGVSLSVRTYKTSFPLTENPISENGNWVNGQAQGLDWANVSTTPGFGRGEQAPDRGTYNDSVALVTGEWGPNQTVETTVKDLVSGANSTREVEIRLRSTVTAHNSTGYEVHWSARPSDPYLGVTRWNGPLNSFKILQSTKAEVGMTDGDTFMATIVGGTVTAYINGVQKIQVTDSHPFASGSPGIGFYLANSKRNPAPQAEYGFSSFRATDDSAVSTISVPPSSRKLTSGLNPPYRPNVALPGGFTGAPILSGNGQRIRGIGECVANCSLLWSCEMILHEREQYRRNSDEPKEYRSSLIRYRKLSHGMEPPRP